MGIIKELGLFSTRLAKNGGANGAAKKILGGAKGDKENDEGKTDFIEWSVRFLCMLKYTHEKALEANDKTPVYLTQDQEAMVITAYSTWK
jgi:hypothetical protein